MKSPRARFVADAARIAGELYDKMEELSKREIVRVKKMAGEALRDQLKRAFVKLDERARLADEVTIRTATEHSFPSPPASGWAQMEPNVLSNPFDGHTVRLDAATFGIEIQGPPMRGLCRGCGVDLDKLVADGMLGHVCGEPRTVMGGRPLLVKPVARRRRNATPSQSVAPAASTDDEDEPARTTNPYSDLERRSRSGKPPELGMRPRIKITRSGYDPSLGPKHPDNHDPTLERWSLSRILAERELAEHSKHPGIPLEDLTCSSWLLGDPVSDARPVVLCHTRD